MTRVAALALTLIVILIPLTVAVDLVAWQCYRDGTQGCPVLPGWLDFLARGRFEAAPPRVAIAALLPLAFITMFWALSRQSLARYEGCLEPQEIRKQIDQDSAGPDGVKTVMRHPRMWAGTARTRWLQRLHLAFAGSVVVCYTGVPVLQGRYHVDKLDAYWWLGLVDLLAAVVGVLALGWVAMTHVDDLEAEYDGDQDQENRRKRLARLANRFLVVAACIVVAHLGLLGFAPFPEGGTVDDRDSLFGRNIWFIGTIVLLAAIHVMLLAVGRFVGRVPRIRALMLGVVAILVFAAASTYLVQDVMKLRGWVALVGLTLVVVLTFSLGRWHHLRRLPSVAWRGAGPSVFLTAAVWIALLFATSAVTATANYLNEPNQSVSDLGTRYGEADEYHLENRSFQATGDITIEDAVIESDASGEVRVHSGAVRVENLRGADPQGAASAHLGGARLRGQTLKVPPGPIVFANSCPVAPAADGKQQLRSCSAENESFRAAGVMNKPAGSELVIGTDVRSVEITVVEPPQRPLTLPQVLVWAPPLQLLWLIAVVITASLCARRLRRAARRMNVFRVQARTDGVRPRDRDECVGRD